jgi:hypothetical protein
VSGNQFTVTWIIEGKVYGQKVFTQPYPHPPDSLAFLCTHCGEVWARAWVKRAVHQAGSGSLWASRSSCCSRCSGGQFDRPGAIPLHFWDLPNAPATDELTVLQAARLARYL